MTRFTRRLTLVLSLPFLLWGILEAPGLLKSVAPLDLQGLTGSPEPLAQPVLQVPGGRALTVPVASPEPQKDVASPAPRPVPPAHRLPVLADLSRIMQMELAVKKYARAFGVDEDLVWSVIRQESGFNPTAISPKGAMGLMQLMPGTADLLGVTNPFDVEQNIAGGIKYLESCLRQFNGDVGLALAAYNAGPNNVIKYQGCPPFPETHQYVAAVLQNYAGQPQPLFVPRAPEQVLPQELAGPPGGSGLHWNLPAPVVKAPRPVWRLPQPRWKAFPGPGRLQARAATSAAPSPRLRPD